MLSLLPSQTQKGTERLDCVHLTGIWSRKKFHPLKPFMMYGFMIIFLWFCGRLWCLLGEEAPTTESWNCLIWKRSVRMSPTINPALPCSPLNHLPEDHIHMFLEWWQGDGDACTFLDSLFQCLTSLLLKTFSLIPNLNIPWQNLRPFPLLLSLVNCKKRPPPAWLQHPLREL